MQIITEEELLKLTEAERCKVLVKIVNGEMIYKGSDKNERNH